MKKKIKICISLAFVMIFAFGSLPTVSAGILDFVYAAETEESENTTAAEEQTEEPSEEPTEEPTDEPTEEPTEEPEPVAINITADTNTIEIGKTVQLNADAVDVKWTSSDTSVATVDKNGLVKGVSAGRSVITASKDAEYEISDGTYEICVTRQGNVVYNFVSDNAIAGYKYSYTDDYFYVDQNSAWQGNFGFNKLYDIAAPYVLLEYDYVRVHYTYEGRDYMVQLWKGQYGLVFYGAEAGIYSKEHSDEEDGVLTTYMPLSGDERPYMQTTLYHDPLHSGDYGYEFTTPYEKTWWSTGFKPGHLTVNEPADELRQSGVITFNNEETAVLFANGLTTCGFAKVSSKDDIPVDSYCIDGTSVYYCWQNISEAENTMGIKVAGASLIYFNFLAIVLAAVMLIGGMAAFSFFAFIIL